MLSSTRCCWRLEEAPRGPNNSFSVHETLIRDCDVPILRRFLAARSTEGEEGTAVVFVLYPMCPGRKDEVPCSLLTRALELSTYPLPSCCGLGAKKFMPGHQDVGSDHGLRKFLSTMMEKLLSRIDACNYPVQAKLFFYKVGVISRLRWYFMIYERISWHHSKRPPGHWHATH